uniref:Transposase n=1 Tax=Parascaris univalens TaxID=6257 RepID=A0A914ZID7_PARUN
HTSTYDRRLFATVEEVITCHNVREWEYRCVVQALQGARDESEIYLGRHVHVSTMMAERWFTKVALFGIQFSTVTTHIRQLKSGASCTILSPRLCRKFNRCQTLC